MRIHLKYRWLRWRIVILIYVMITTMMCYTDVQTSHNNTPIFEEWYAAHRGLLFPLILMIYLMLQLFLMYRDDHRSQKRLSLLPHNPCIRFYGDVVFILMVMVALTIGYISMYLMSFHTYIAYLDEKNALLFQQTRDVLVSLRHCFATSWIVGTNILVTLSCIACYVLGAEAITLINKLCIKGNKRLWSYYMLCLLVVVLGVQLYDRVSPWILFFGIIVLCMIAWQMNIRQYKVRRIGGK